MANSAKYILASVLLGLVCFVVPGCSNPASDELDYVPGQLIVQLTESFSQEQAVDLTDSYEIVLIEYFEHVAIILVGVPEGQETKWKKKLEEDEFISSASLVRNNVTLR